MDKPELLQRCKSTGTSTWSDALDTCGIAGVVRGLVQRGAHETDEQCLVAEDLHVFLNESTITSATASAAKEYHCNAYDSCVATPASLRCAAAASP